MVLSRSDDGRQTFTPPEPLGLPDADGTRCFDPTLAQLSTDDGATWNDGPLLDERSGVSYPDGVQEKDGLIWITYDRDRGNAGEILLAKFKEEDVAAGKNVSGAVSLKQVVNKLNKPTILPAN